MNRFDCLKAASDAVVNREQRYGPPQECFRRIARLWEAYGFAVNGGIVLPTDVAAAMMLVDIARTANGCSPDSWVDAAGYAALGAELEAPSDPQDT